MGRGQSGSRLGSQEAAVGDGMTACMVFRLVMGPAVGGSMVVRVVMGGVRWFAW